jgi:hypothetical protein
LLVIPAQAGIHFDFSNGNLDLGLRRDDADRRFFRGTLKRRVAA